MLIVNDLIRIPEDELAFEFARSGGPGGQNVNKVSSKALLRWNPAASSALPPAVRERFLAAQGSRLTKEGEILIVSDRYRDQPRNIADCLEKLKAMILAAAVRPKRRRPTKPTKASVTRRIEGKARRSETKRERRRPERDDE